MEQFRSVNGHCVVCGSHVPGAIECERNGDLHQYKCPSCGDTILEGVLSEGGEYPDVRIPPHVCNGVYVRERTEWTTWESWWTDYSMVCALNGRSVSGQEELLDFVKKVMDIHEHS